MKFWTLGEIREKIESDCDLQDEDFIRSSEFIGLVNEAIDEAESEIHTLYEDYFLKYTDLPVAVADEFFSMSTLIPDIYADKIREIIFTLNDGITTYTVNRIRDWKKFKIKAVSDNHTTTDLYEYFLVNQTPGNPQIMLVPKSREIGSMKVWYLRNANRVSIDADICDIPEFINFIFWHVKANVYGKEGNPGYADAVASREAERARMVGTLAARTPDNENTIELDSSYYEEMN